MTKADWRGNPVDPKLVARNLARSRESVVRRMQELLNRAEELDMEPYPTDNHNGDHAVIFSWGGHDTVIEREADTTEWKRSLL